MAEWTARRLLLPYELVTVAHCSTNLTGRPLHERLGFRMEHYFDSGVWTCCYGNEKPPR